MSDNTAVGCLGAFLWIGAIALSIVAGILAWNWIEPDSFGSVILFLIAWSFLNYIGSFIVMGILALFSKKDV